MALSQQWVNQTALAQSDAITPTDHLAVCISGVFTGDVWVEFLNPHASEENWYKVQNTQRRESDYFVIDVPDQNVQFRFACVNIVGTVNCYLGPGTVE